jgi:arsenite-transporting ATPase
MRVVLFTGKGGVGKTTLAASTGALTAAAGRKTLVISTDAAHSLGDVLDVPLGPDPVEVDGGLFGMHLDARSAAEHAWRDVEAYVQTLLSAGPDLPGGAPAIPFPGADEVAALLAVRDAARGGDYDVICVDCAPTAETLRLLRLPETLDWWARRLFSDENRLARSLRPMLGRLTGLPLPDDGVFDAVGRLRRELAEVRALLADSGTCGVRIVLTPERVVVAEARRAMTALALHGYRVDGVVVNRVLPAGRDAWRGGWVRSQAEQLEQIGHSFAGLPQWQVPYAAAEPIGRDALVALAAGSYGTADAATPESGPAPIAVQATDEGYAMTLALPFADRGDVELTRTGDELTITVGSERRILVLPSALRRCEVAGARFAEGRLAVRFVPDPALWPRT